MKLLVENKLLGTKSGQGFYKTVVDEKGKKSFWGLDPQVAAEDGTLEYVAPANRLEQRRRCAQPTRWRIASRRWSRPTTRPAVGLARLAHHGLRLKRVPDRRQPGRHR